MEPGTGTRTSEFGTLEPDYCGSHLNMFFITNQRLAGRSASLLMYQGNQYSP
jgi:hypothetical protein